jgi:chromosome segregation ATPase
MRTITERLHEVRLRVDRLVRDHGGLQHAHAALEVRMHEYQRMVDVLKARVAELERENEVLRQARAAEERAPAPIQKEKIDELVHEIDRCLALLNG